MLKSQASVEIKNQAVGYIAGALGLVAGLAWNDAIKSLIEFVFPFSKSSIWIKFIYALIITLIVVFVTQYLLKPQPKS